MNALTYLPGTADLCIYYQIRVSVTAHWYSQLSTPTGAVIRKPEFIQLYTSYTSTVSQYTERKNARPLLISIWENMSIWRCQHSLGMYFGSWSLLGDGQQKPSIEETVFSATLILVESTAAIELKSSAADSCWTSTWEWSIIMFANSFIAVFHFRSYYDSYNAA